MQTSSIEVDSSWHSIARTWRPLLRSSSCIRKEAWWGAFGAQRTLSSVSWSWQRSSMHRRSRRARPCANFYFGIRVPEKRYQCLWHLCLWNTTFLVRWAAWKAISTWRDLLVKFWMNATISSRGWFAIVMGRTNSPRNFFMDSMSRFRWVIFRLSRFGTRSASKTCPSTLSQGCQSRYACTRALPFGEFLVCVPERMFDNIYS